MAALVARAQRDDLVLVTTEKDMARMNGDPAARILVGRTAVLGVTMVFRDEAAVGRMLRDVARGGARTASAL
jgi:tetraacyldisaccharide-1-P 4'-kinase